MRLPAGFMIAGCDVPCMDVWPLSKVRKTALMAYLALERGGEIRIRYPVMLYKDRMAIEYVAQMPHEWTRERLKQAEDTLVQSLTDERDLLGRRIEGMAGMALTDELLPVFEQTAARYMEIQKILLQEDHNDGLQTQLQEHTGLDGSQ